MLRPFENFTQPKVVASTAITANKRGKEIEETSHAWILNKKTLR